MSQVCKFEMGRICNPEECECDEDITDVTNYEHLKEAIIFCDDDIVNGEE